MSSRTRRVKASDELVAQIGYGTVDLFHGQPVAVTGIGTDRRVLDGDGYTGLRPDEDVVFRKRDRWWLVAAANMADAYARAGDECRAIDLDNPAHVRAVVLPASAAERDAMLKRLTSWRGA